MIAREFILKGKKNFEKVQKEGRIFQSNSFGLSILERGDTDPSRFAFVVSGKISKEAVQRNRIKRALSEAVRFEMTRLKRGFDVIFLAKQVSTTKATGELMHEAVVTLTEAGLAK